MTTIRENFAFSFLIGSALAALGIGQDSAPQETHPTEPIAITEGWSLSLGPANRGRDSLPKDPLEYAWINGTLKMPNRQEDESPSAPELATWKRLAADASGQFTGRGLGSGWLATFADVPSDGVWMLEAQGNASVRVNGALRTGDVYSNGSLELPVSLKAGTNSFLFSGLRGRLVAKLRAPDKNLFLSQRDPTFPHILRGESETLLGAVVLVNATQETQKGMVLQASGPGFQATSSQVPDLLPLSVRKVAFRIQPNPETQAQAWKPDSIQIDLEILRNEDPSSTKVIDRRRFEWTIRDPNKTHRRTFVSSIDGSVQYYAVVPPKNTEDQTAERPGLVLTLHGAGVEGEGQAGAYAAKPNLYLIAPTNRRPFGFDWEDWGRLDALEVLQQASARFNTDPQRTYLTGHSMGGHGTWHIGSLFPDRFAAIAPSAGWISFSTYAGMRPTTGTNDAMSAMLKRSSLTSDTLARAQNLAQQGIYILHGDADDNVPVEQARTMRESLAKFHPDFVYKEQPGAGHWWGNPCVDWPPLFRFFADHQLPKPDEVLKIDFTTPSPGVVARCHWITIAAQQQQSMISKVELQCNRTDRKISGTTQNCARLQVHLDALAFPADAGKNPNTLILELDGNSIVELQTEGKSSLWLERTTDGWREIQEPANSEKNPLRYGSLKEAFRNQFVLVYGTGGSEDENRWMMERARYDAELFGYRGNGSVDVVSDQQWKSITGQDRSVIVFGNASINRAWSELLADAPVKLKNKQYQLNQEEPKEESVSFWMVRPRLSSSTASIAAVGGTDLRAMQSTNRVPLYSSGTAYPDLLIASPEFLLNGGESVKIAGYFGLDWSFETGEWARAN